MKYSITATLLIFAAIFHLHAESPFAREFQQLRDQRDKAAAAAIEPINRKYQASLEQLLRRATQGSDLETALHIKEALGSQPAVTAPSPTSTSGHKPTKRQIEKLLTEGKWVLLENADSAITPAPSNVRTVFKNDGNFHSIDGRVHQWTIAQDGTVKLIVEAFENYGLELTFRTETEITLKRVGKNWNSNNFSRFIRASE